MAAGEMAPAIWGIPVVSGSSERTTLFPTPTTSQRVQNLATGNIERYDGTAWVVDFLRSPSPLAYGAKGDGVTDDAPAIQLAINAARLIGAPLIIPAGRYLLNSPLNLTFASTDTGTSRRAILIRGETTTSLGPSSDASSCTLIANHTGHLFDCAGSYDMIFENLNLGTAAGVTAKTGWFFARNSAGWNAGIHRLINCRAYGSFANAVVYSYASEQNFYQSCSFVNTAANPVVFKWTSGNIDSLASTFITVATGAQSNIVSRIVGGEFQAKGANGKVFYVDRHNYLSIEGPWVMSAEETGHADGHSILYVDMTNGASDYGSLSNVTGENQADLPTYGAFFTNHAQTPVGWRFNNVRFPSRTNPINVGALARALLWHIEDVKDEANTAHNAVFGLLDTPYVKAQELKFTVTTLTSPFIIGAPSYWTIGTRNGGVFFDTTTGGHSFAGTQVPSTDANTLDDYEEGDWTPVLGGDTSESGQTYSNQVGFYVKVGRVVTCTFHVSLSVPGTITGNSVIKGLPFTSGNGNKYRAGAAIGTSSGLGISVVSLSAWVESNSNKAYLYHRTAAAAGDTQSPNTMIQSGAAPFLIGTITYIAAS